MGHCISISETVIRQALVPNDPFATVQVKNDKWPSPIRIVVSRHWGQFKDTSCGDLKWAPSDTIVNEAYLKEHLARKPFPFPVI